MNTLRIHVDVIEQMRDLCHWKKIPDMKQFIEMAIKAYGDKFRDRDYIGGRGMSEVVKLGNMPMAIDAECIRGAIKQQIEAMTPAYEHWLANEGWELNIITTMRLYGFEDRDEAIAFINDQVAKARKRIKKKGGGS